MPGTALGLPVINVTSIAQMQVGMRIKHQSNSKDPAGIMAGKI